MKTNEQTYTQTYTQTYAQTIETWKVIWKERPYAVRKFYDDIKWEMQWESIPRKLEKVMREKLMDNLRSNWFHTFSCPQYLYETFLKIKEEIKDEKVNG